MSLTLFVGDEPANTLPPDIFDHIILVKITSKLNDKEKRRIKNELTSFQSKPNYGKRFNFDPNTGHFIRIYDAKDDNAFPFIAYYGRGQNVNLTKFKNIREFMNSPEYLNELKSCIFKMKQNIYAFARTLTIPIETEDLTDSITKLDHSTAKVYHSQPLHTIQVRRTKPGTEKRVPTYTRVINGREENGGDYEQFAHYSRRTPDSQDQIVALDGLKKDLVVVEYPNSPNDKTHRIPFAPLILDEEIKGHFIKNGYNLNKFTAL